MVQTWKSQTGGADANLEVGDRRCDADPIAVQWAAIATKLASLASLKEDVAILAQILGYEQIEEKTRNQPIHFRSRSYNPSPAAESVEKDDGQTPQYNDVMPDPITKDEPLQGNGFSWEWGMEVAELKEVETDDKPNQVPKAVRGYGSEQSPKQSTDAQCTNAKAQGTTCRSTKLQRGHRRLVLNCEGAWDYKLQGKPPDVRRHPHFAERGTVRLGASMKVIDIGGGLGIDYDGSKSADSDVSVGHTLEDYAAAIVQAVKFVCDRKSVKHPVICSESGRAIVLHHPILMSMVGCARQEIRGIVGGKSRSGEAVNVDSNRTLLFNRIKACLWVWIMPTCFWLLDLHFGPSSIFGPLPSDRPTTVGPLFEQQSDSARANTQQPWIGFANNRLEDKSSFGAESIDTILPLGSRVIGKQGGGN